MEKQVQEFVAAKTKELLAAHSCCQELKDAANAWLAAVGTDKEAEATKNYIAEMEEDITTIDALIALTESELGAKIFGDAAAAVGQQAKDAKAKGAHYCFCDACAACEAMLAKKDELLK